MAARIRFSLGILISVLFLYLSLRKVDFGVVLNSFAGLDPRFLVLCVLCQFGSLLARAYLWTHILYFEKRIRYRNSFEALLIGYMGNNILPFRMGELMRAYAIGKKEGISRTLAFASVILERLIDLLVLLLFFVLLLFMMTVEDRLIKSGIIVFVFLALAVLLLFTVATDLLGIPSKTHGLFIGLVPPGLRSSAERISRSFLRGIKLIRTFRQALWLVFLSVVAWVLWTSILYFGLKALHLGLPVTATILLTVVIHIGVMIPSSPGFIGVFQWLCIFSLAFFGVSKELALTFSFLVHTIQFIPTTLMGWLYMTRMHVAGYRSLKRELNGSDA